MRSIQIFFLRRFWGFNVKFRCGWLKSTASILCGDKPNKVCRARIPLLIVVALAGVNYVSRFKARGLRLGLHPAFALKREPYPHLREVK